MFAHSTSFVLSFSDVDKEDVHLVGEKGANLGEIIKAGFPVPDGFIISSHAYFNFLRENRLSEKINHLLSTVNYERPESIEQVSSHIKRMILEAELSEDLIKDVTQEYTTFSGLFKQKLVAVRPSVTIQDLPVASLAGKQQTYLNIKGYSNLLLKIKECWTSLFDTSAIFYRHENNFDQFRIGIAVIVQQMVESEKSGVMFTIDPVNNAKNTIVIEAVLGLGEILIQGEITPDHYEVNKSSLIINHKKILHQEQMIKKSGFENRMVKVSASIRNQQKITDEEIIRLAEIGKKLEHHYYFPQDCEWAIENNNIYILQTRPVTTFSKDKTKSSYPMVTKHGQLLLKGNPTSPGIASGQVKILDSLNDIKKVLPGEVLVTKELGNDYILAMKKANAIVTQTGGKTSPAAIVSRELGIPAIMGLENAVASLKNGEVVTVNGTLGEVYSGGFISSVNKKELLISSHIKTATKLYVDLSEPNMSYQISQQNIDGVGLLRAEVIISKIGVHPKKIIHDGTERAYIAKLAGELEKVCRNFNQRPVIYRLSDFKTNEYRNLVGGKTYELNETNPLLGFHGAFRLIHDARVFEMELEAVKIVRNKMGLKNLWIMVPFVRNVNEFAEVKKIIAASGLYRSPSFKLYMLCETPSNVITLEKFIEVGLDGISIGSNHLTTLMLGTDKDNSEMAHEFNEQDESLLWAIEHVIKICKKHNIQSSICEYATDISPDLLEKLIVWGISSVSVSPHEVNSVREHISQVESHL